MKHAQKPGAESTRTVAPPSCKERSWEHRSMSALPRSSCFSLLIRVVKVCHETVSLSRVLIVSDVGQHQQQMNSQWTEGVPGLTGAGMFND